MNDKEAVEAVAQAIADVKLFLRVNVGGSDSVDGYPVEICRYGDEGEDEIVVIARFDASSYENDLLSHFVREHRASAALAAARPHILEEAARIVEDGFNKEVGTAYRDDGVASKNDKCPHGIWMYEDCEACAAAAIRAAKETDE